MSAEEAQAYHATQIDVFSKTNADMVSGLTLTYPAEAIGIARAAKAVGMPVVISFTLETDGRLPTGQTLKEAIELVDQATQNTPAYYMIGFMELEVIVQKKSHAELNEAKELDEGDPVEFGEDNRALLNMLKNLNTIGGCCGTNHRHIEEICKACINVFNQLKRVNHDEIQSTASIKTD
ncbi:unnamed protein product [Rotaria sp. Silwood1]|nr:unnamed protein product [Rotaria sp. Silwood1]